ncbi:hypothetical protein GCM10022245_69540 [Streptomyces mayteni]
MAWAVPGTTPADRDLILGPGGGDRVHAVEYGWLERMAAVQLYAYRLPAGSFRPFGTPVAHAMVATENVAPLGPAEPVGDVLALHRAAGIQLRVLDNLWEFWDAVVASSLGFSGVRLGNAVPRAPEAPSA